MGCRHLGTWIIRLLVDVMFEYTTRSDSIGSAVLNTKAFFFFSNVGKYIAIIPRISNVTCVGSNCGSTKVGCNHT